jgi:hypothetical protein
MKKLFFITIVLIGLNSFAQEDPDYLSKETVQALKQVKVKNLNLSMVNLIATPERFDGEMVQVRGYIHMEAGYDGIYMHEDDYKNKITANALWVEFDEEFSESRNRLDHNDKYVIIIGEFKQSDKGKGDNFSGSIKKIIRIDEASSPHK